MASGKPGANASNFGMAGPTINTAPYPPTLIAPANGATGVTTSPTLNVSVSDPESNSLSVTFYGRVPNTYKPDFSLVAIPDTQIYSMTNNGIFGVQTQWIVDQQTAQNIAFVSHLGDMVDSNDAPPEWVVASAAMNILESAGIPYGIGIGNCDEDNDGVPLGTNTHFLDNFPASRFAGRPYYGGAYNGDNSNSYQLFSASGLDFIVIDLEYNLSTSPDQSLAVLAWANTLLQTYSNRRAIVITHNLLDTSNNLSADGSQIYTSLKGNSNLFLMMGGHLDTEGMRQDLGSDGHTIYSLRSDYQTRANGGNGWLRLVRFSPGTNKINIFTYSPYLSQYETDADSQFSLDYNMNGGTPAFQVIGTASVPSGSSASVAWPGLLPQTQYEWYVTVNDGTSTTTGPTWNFTTQAASNHTVTFNSNGGTGTLTPQVANHPTALKANTFTRLGYTFSGWNTLANGTGTAYADGATYAFSADVTLYAQWSKLPKQTIYLPIVFK
jgi:uncharacterized repeat protein (TIGR02543 family)